MKIMIYLGYGLCLYLFYVFYCRLEDYTWLSQVPNFLFTASALIALVKKHMKLEKKS